MGGMRESEYVVGAEWCAELAASMHGFISSISPSFPSLLLIFVCISPASLGLYVIPSAGCEVPALAGLLLLRGSPHGHGTHLPTSSTPSRLLRLSRSTSTEPTLFFLPFLFFFAGIPHFIVSLSLSHSHSLFLPPRAASLPHPDGSQFASHPSPPHRLVLALGLASSLAFNRVSGLGDVGLDVKHQLTGSS